MTTFAPTWGTPVESAALRPNVVREQRLLRLRRRHLCPNQIAVLAASLGLGAATTVVDLAENDCGDRGAASIASALLSPQTRITSLDVSDCGIGEAGAQALAGALSRNTTLRSLCLSSNDMVGGSAPGVSALCAALRKNSALRSLDLSSTALSAAGAEELAEALSGAAGASLLELRLGDNPVGASAAALVAVRSLTRLDLSEASLGDDGVSRARVRPPGFTCPRPRHTRRRPAWPAVPAGRRPRGRAVVAPPSGS